MFSSMFLFELTFFIFSIELSSWLPLPPWNYYGETIFWLSWTCTSTLLKKKKTWMNHWKLAKREEGMRQKEHQCNNSKFIRSRNWFSLHSWIKRYFWLVFNIMEVKFISSMPIYKLFFFLSLYVVLNHSCL